MIIFPFSPTLFLLLRTRATRGKQQQQKKLSTSSSSRRRRRRRKSAGRPTKLGDFFFLRDEQPRARRAASRKYSTQLSAGAARHRVLGAAPSVFRSQINQTHLLSARLSFVSQSVKGDFSGDVRRLIALSPPRASMSADYLRNPPPAANRRAPPS